jgi:hypothetical protein
MSGLDRKRAAVGDELIRAGRTVDGLDRERRSGHDEG